MAVQEESEISLLLDGVQGSAEGSLAASMRGQHGGVPRATPAFGCAPSAITMVAGPAGDDGWSGWVSGGAGTPPPERDETADVSMMRQGSMPWEHHSREGCNGRRAAGLPCQDCGTTPHILRQLQTRLLSILADHDEPPPASPCARGAALALSPCSASALSRRSSICSRSTIPMRDVTA